MIANLSKCDFKHRKQGKVWIIIVIMVLTKLKSNQYKQFKSMVKIENMSLTCTCQKSRILHGHKFHSPLWIKKLSYLEDCEIAFQMSTYVGHTTALSSQIHNCRIRKLFDMTHVNIQAWVCKYHTTVHNSSMSRR